MIAVKKDIQKDIQDKSCLIFFTFNKTLYAACTMAKSILNDACTIMTPLSTGGQSHIDTDKYGSFLFIPKKMKSPELELANPFGTSTA